MGTYDPKGYAKAKRVDAVQFTEAEPPAHLSSVVHRFVELKTIGTLDEDYRFHALPDACTYIVFNQLDPRVTGVTTLRAKSEELNLGRNFHFVNIRFLPGVCHFNHEQSGYGQVDASYDGDLPLLDVSQRLMGRSFEVKQLIMSELVEHLMATKKVVPNAVTQKIFRNLEDINTVSDMAASSELSPRQLQRTLKRTTGFAPHDFLKVLRLQQALSNASTDNYADQSHFIHSFRKATGYTPGRYAKEFDV